jgi:prevent-host-death family protein
MHSAKIADLKNNLSRYLAQVRRGAEVTVLDRDTPVARIVPFVPRGEAATGKATRRAKMRDDYWTPERLAGMEREGLIRRGDAGDLNDWLETHKPVKLPKGSPRTLDLLLKTRRESTR